MTEPSGTDELSRLLRVLRTETRVTGAEIARQCGWSESKVNRFLHGRIVPKPDDVLAILQVMGMADDERGRRAVELAELHPAGHATRQHILRTGTLVAQRRYREIDGSSAHVRTFTATIVPGLLQSSGYIRAVFSSAGDPTSDDLTALITERTARQAMLRAGGERRYTMVMTEGALRWNVGPAVMAEQLELIAEYARSAPSTVQIGIIPWWQVVDTFPMVSINLYDERAVIVNTGNGVTHITNERDVAVYLSDFDRLCHLALWGPDAATEADRIAEEYRAIAAIPTHAQTSAPPPPMTSPAPAPAATRRRS